MSTYQIVTSAPVMITGTAPSHVHRRPSPPATAAHGSSHATYCGLNTGEHTSSAATAASAGTPAGSSSRRRASSQIATTVATVSSSRAPGAHAGIVPDRFAPSSNRCCPVSAHTGTPIVEPISHPVDPRNVPTWRSAPGPPIAIQVARPAAAAIAAVVSARIRRSRASAGATTIGHSFVSTAAPSATPPARSRSRRAHARPSAASATGTRSLRR